MSIIQVFHVCRRHRYGSPVREGVYLTIRAGRLFTMLAAAVVAGALLIAIA